MQASSAAQFEWYVELVCKTLAFFSAFLLCLIMLGKQCPHFLLVFDVFYVPGNKITKIGRIWISKYLKDAAENDAHYVNIISSAQYQEPSTESNASMASRPGDSQQIENVLARIRDLMADNLLSLEEKFHMIRLCAGGRKFEWQQSWQLTLPFLRSPLCFCVAQWYSQIGCIHWR